MINRSTIRRSTIVDQSPIWINHRSGSFDGERGDTRIGCYQFRYTEIRTGVIIVFFVAEEWDFASMKPVGRQRSFLKRDIPKLI